MAKAKSQAMRRDRAPHQADAERWTRLLIIGGVVTVIVLAVGIIAFGWYWTQIRPLGKTVLRVGDTTVSLGQLQARMRLSLEEDSSFRQSEQYLRALPDITLSELEREAKFLEAAHELNKIAVTDEELEAKILESGTGKENAVLAEELNRLVRESGLSEGEYLQMIRAKLLEEKVRNYFTFYAPKQEPQVHARLILLADKSDAEEALQRLEAGEDFAAVARDVSEESASAERGGELDWLPRSSLPEEAETFLFEDAQPGQRSEVISSGSAAYIVQLLERDEDRQLTDEQRPAVIERLLNDWLASLNSKLKVERDFTEEDANRALNEVLS